jgi:lysozyme family protein
MNTTFRTAISQILATDGGWKEHPKSVERSTHHGISLAVYRQHLDALGSLDDLRVMERDEAVWVYRRAFWDAVGGDELPAGVDLALFDWAVCTSPARAVTGLQRCLDLHANGKICAATVGAAHQYQPRPDLVRAIGAERLSFLSTLKGWKEHRKDWMGRVRNIEVSALALL